MIYSKLPHHFSLFCVSFGSHSKHHYCCNIHLKSESITGQLASKSVIMTKLPGSSRTVVFVLFLLRMKVLRILFSNTSQTVFMKTVHILRTSFSMETLFLFFKGGHQEFSEGHIQCHKYQNTHYVGRSFSCDPTGLHFTTEERSSKQNIERAVSCDGHNFGIFVFFRWDSQWFAD